MNVTIMISNPIIIIIIMESELVSGFMTEHAAVVFVFFFLAEYSSILLMCILTSLFFLGGYLEFIPLLSQIEAYYEISYVFSSFYGSFLLGIKTCLLVFAFIWCRASFPRIRFDQLMSFCWTKILPLLFAFIVLVPSILYSFDAITANISLF